MVIGIETDRGLWVAALVGAGYQVYAINPKAVARIGNATAVRAPSPIPVTPRCSPTSSAPTGTTIARWPAKRPGPGDQGTGPGPSATGVGTAPPDQRSAGHPAGVLPGRPCRLRRRPRPPRRRGRAGAGPQPRQGPRPSVSAVAAALRRGGRRRNVDGRARQIRDALRSEQLTPPAELVDACAVLVGSTVGVLAEMNRQLQRLETELDEKLSDTRTPRSSAVSQDSASSSAPGCSASSETTRTATSMLEPARTTPAPHRSPSPPANAKSSRPATSATGTSPTPATCGPSPPSPPHRCPPLLRHPARTWQRPRRRPPRPGNRLVGILDGCLRHHTLYSEQTAWGHRTAQAA